MTRCGAPLDSIPIMGRESPGLSQARGIVPLSHHNARRGGDESGPAAFARKGKGRRPIGRRAYRKSGRGVVVGLAFSS